jgi:hypothetical protein
METRGTREDFCKHCFVLVTSGLFGEFDPTLAAAHLFAIRREFPGSRARVGRLRIIATEIRMFGMRAFTGALLPRCAETREVIIRIPVPRPLCAAESPAGITVDSTWSMDGGDVEFYRRIIEKHCTRNHAIPKVLPRDVVTWVVDPMEMRCRRTTIAGSMTDFARRNAAMCLRCDCDVVPDAGATAALGMECFEFREFFGMPGSGRQSAAETEESERNIEDRDGESGWHLMWPDSTSQDRCETIQPQDFTDDR